MTRSAAPRESRLSRSLRWLPYGVLVFAIGFGVVRGVRKWRRDLPEWRYWRLIAVTPIEVITVPRGDLYGFLPGFKAILVPFVATAPIGYFVFAAINAASCFGIVWILGRRLRFPRREGPSRAPPGLWVSVCAAAPCFFALQNNQVVAPAVFCVLYGFASIERRRPIPGGVSLAVAVLLRSVPLPLFLVPLLLGRWKAFIAAALSLCLLSFGLAAVTDGVMPSVRAHLRWPRQVLGQRPELALVGEAEPISFSQNRSPLAEAVRLSQAAATRAPLWAFRTVMVLSFGVLVAVTVRARHLAEWFWPLIAGWTAWVGFAAPYSRYYHLLFLVPAWSLWALVVDGDRTRRRLGWFLPVPLLAIWIRRIGSAYAAVSTATLLLFVGLVVARFFHAFSRPGGSGSGCAAPES